MNIYVGNLPFQVDDQQLQAMFEAHGAVQSARVVLDRESGRSRGFGFVEMVRREDGQAAIEALNNHEVKGRRLKVNESQPKPPRSGGGGGGGGGFRPRGDRGDRGGDRGDRGGDRGRHRSW